MPPSPFICSFSVIGAAIIVLGLYALIWGKSKDSVADVSASGGSKGASAAAAVELPITLAQPNGNGGGGKPNPKLDSQRAYVRQE